MLAICYVLLSLLWTTSFFHRVRVLYYYHHYHYYYYYHYIIIFPITCMSPLFLPLIHVVPRL